MSKLLLASALSSALFCGFTAHAATASSAGAHPTPSFGTPQVLALTERDIETVLIRQGYRVDHIDRRGDSFFVRVVRGYDIYDGYIGRDDGLWIVRGWMGRANDGSYWARAEHGEHRACGILNRGHRDHPRERDTL